jgi:hypothetical protein
MKNLVESGIVISENKEVCYWEKRTAARSLLRALTTTTSVYQGLIKCPKLVKHTLTALVNGEELGREGRQTLGTYFPLLRDYLAEVDSLGKPIPAELVPLCRRLSEKCLLSVQEDEREENRDWHTVAIREDLERGVWLPSLGQERHFHRYATPTRDWELFDCKKDYKGKHSSLLPGIFTFSCPHGFYLGEYIYTFFK